VAGKMKEACIVPTVGGPVVFHAERSAIIALDSRHRMAQRAVTIAELQARPADAAGPTGVRKRPLRSTMDSAHAS
jgi:hypothetical protein